MTDTDFQNEEDQDGIEMDDLDEESESENESENENGEKDDAEDSDAAESVSVNPDAKQMPASSPGRAARMYEKLKENGSAFVDKAKDKGENLFSSGMSKAQDIYENNREGMFNVYDRVMNVKDKIKDATKHSSGKWETIKTGASIIGDEIKSTDTYKAIANSRIGKSFARGAGFVKSGATAIADKIKGSALGKWVAKKIQEKKEKADEPGIFSKLWGGIKSGASAIKDKVKGSALGKWVSKKIQERKEKADEPGIFSKMWGGIKSGAAKLKDKAANTKLGKWISAKMASKSDKPGFFSRTWGKIKGGASKLINKVKNTDAAKWISSEYGKGKAWVNEQKEWLNNKKERLLALKDKIADEFDDHEHERRMAYKAKNGDVDYEKRYNEYVKELKNNSEIMEILANLKSSDIKSAMDELESGKDEKEGKKEGKDSIFKTAAGISGKLESAAKSEEGKFYLNKYAGEGGVKYAPTAMKVAGNLLNATDNFVQSRKFGKRADDMRGLKEEVGDDRKLANLATSQEEIADQKRVANKYDAWGNVLTAGKNGLKLAPGGGTLSTIASVAKFGVDIKKKSEISSMEKKSVKRSLKEIIGGPEGYKALKSKYKLQAQEMRRGMREAVGMRSEKDVVDLEQDNLVNYAKGQAAKGNPKAKKTLDRIGKDAINTVRENAFKARNNTKRYGGAANVRVM